MWWRRKRKDDEDLGDADHDELSLETALEGLQSPQSRVEVLEALASGPETLRFSDELIEATIEHTNSSDGDVRIAAMEVIAAILSDVEGICTNIAPTAVRAMTDKSADVRESANEAVSSINELRDMLSHTTLDWDAMGALLERGDVSEQVLENLAHLDATGLLHRLRSDDEELLELAAVLEGFSALERLPRGEVWAGRAAATIAVSEAPFPDDEPISEIWALYAGLLVPGLDGEAGEDLADAIESLASASEEMRAVIAADEPSMSAIKRSIPPEMPIWDILRADA